jgi:hypothetical protein
MKSVSRIIAVILLVIIFLIVVIGLYYFVIGAPSFSIEAITSIHISVIHGMAGLGAVAIAVFIFRIGGLENRSKSLEETTLNYISQTFGWSYPEWTRSLEEDITNKTLTSRYFIDPHSATEKLISEEKDRQQRRLEEAVRIHARIRQTIARMRKDVFYAVIFLIVPVIMSLLLLMAVDLLGVFWNFFFISTVILICSLGILLLIKIVLESTLKEPDA